MKMDGITLISVIVIVAFGIERMVSGLLFLLGFVKPWARRFPNPALIEDPAAKAAATNKGKLAYFTIAGVLGVLVMAYFGNIRLLQAVGIDTHAAFDVVLTGLILVAGADRIGDLLKLPGAKGRSAAEPKPIQIAGRLTVEGEGLRGPGSDPA